MMTTAATVFTVSDIGASVGYYRDALGFTVTFQYGDPPICACLRRDDVNLHLVAAQGTRRVTGDGALSVLVNDVEALYTELAARGARVFTPPQNDGDGMRDFGVVDPDGNNLTFGMQSGGWPFLSGMKYQSDPQVPTMRMLSVKLSSARSRRLMRKIIRRSSSQGFLAISRRKEFLLALQVTQLLSRALVHGSSADG
jgi:uncharacterized glyoxalase superfamily protein PhnB